MKSPSAVALGRMAKGKPKTLTAAQRKRQRARLAAVRAARWPTPTREVMLAALPALDRAATVSGTHGSRSRALAARYRRLIAADLKHSGLVLSNRERLLLEQMGAKG